ncbi:MAG TPA: Gfo/Idh/MocA family oxidoreductase [Blastocatellia bacterium]|nr:Gfo/Idh/MocA family oxidoreductase [Blastocatellia bacterium]
MEKHLGILGGGNISRTHLRAAGEIDGVKVAAVCGQNLEKARQLAVEAGAAVYQDPDKFLDHRPMDAVLIGSPSGLHAEQGIAAAKRGLHVLVEKPIDIDVERAEQLIEACEIAGVKLGVFFQDRVAPDLQKLKSVIDSGVLGSPILMSASVRWYRPPEYYENSRWRGTRALDGGGALMNQGIHTVDLLLWLCGDVSSVWSRAITALHHIEVEDTLVASFQFSSGAIGNLEVATSAYPGFSRRIDMTWSQGTITIEDDKIKSVNLREPIAGLCALREMSSEPKINDERAVSPVVSNTKGHRAIIEDFVQAIDCDRAPLCSGEEATRSVQLVNAMYHSARNGVAVDLNVRTKV